MLAFFAGGFFDGPRDVALVVAGVVLGLVAAAAPRGELIPRNRAAQIALAAAVAYAAWIALSATWAPVADYAGDDAERALLYAVVLTAAAGAFRPRAAVRALEALAAAGTVIVVGYGILGRLLPGVITEHPQASAAGRLDQPLTYWNAMGALAAIGLVLCARIAGDRDREPALRAAAAAAAVPLGMGCYLSFSRGAFAALAAGLLALIVLAPTGAQLRAAVLVLAAGRRRRDRGSGGATRCAPGPPRSPRGSVRARSCSSWHSCSWRPPPSPLARRSPSAPCACHATPAGSPSPPSSPFSSCRSPSRAGAKAPHPPPARPTSAWGPSAPIATPIGASRSTRGPTIRSRASGRAASACRLAAAPPRRRGRPRRPFARARDVRRARLVGVALLAGAAGRRRRGRRRGASRRSGAGRGARRRARPVGLPQPHRLGLGDARPDALRRGPRGGAAGRRPAATAPRRSEAPRG